MARQVKKPPSGLPHKGKKPQHTTGMSDAMMNIVKKLGPAGALKDTALRNPRRKKAR